MVKGFFIGYNYKIAISWLCLEKACLAILLYCSLHGRLERNKKWNRPQFFSLQLHCTQPAGTMLEVMYDQSPPHPLQHAMHL